MSASFNAEVPQSNHLKNIFWLSLIFGLGRIIVAIYGFWSVVNNFQQALLISSLLALVSGALYVSAVFGINDRKRWVINVVMGAAVIEIIATLLPFAMPSLQGGSEIGLSKGIVLLINLLLALYMFYSFSNPGSSTPSLSALRSQGQSLIFWYSVTACTALLTIFCINRFIPLVISQVGGGPDLYSIGAIFYIFLYIWPPITFVFLLLNLLTQPRNERFMITIFAAIYDVLFVLGWFIIQSLLTANHDGGLGIAIFVFIPLGLIHLILITLLLLLGIRNTITHLKRA